MGCCCHTMGQAGNVDTQVCEYEIKFEVRNLSELKLEVRSQLFYISPGHSLLYFALILAVSVLCRTNLSVHVSDFLGFFCFCFLKKKKNYMSFWEGSEHFKGIAVKRVQKSLCAKLAVILLMG